MPRYIYYNTYLHKMQILVRYFLDFFLILLYYCIVKIQICNYYKSLNNVVIKANTDYKKRTIGTKNYWQNIVKINLERNELLNGI